MVTREELVGFLRFVVALMFLVAGRPLDVLLLRRVALNRLFKVQRRRLAGGDPRGACGFLDVGRPSPQLDRGAVGGLHAKGVGRFILISRPCDVGTTRR